MKKGDRVTIYMPMVPEAAIAMLACTRIGAPHSVIFGGFSADAVNERIHDAESTVLITADGGWRRGGIVPLKRNVDEALRECPDVKTVIVLNEPGRTSTCNPAAMSGGTTSSRTPRPVPAREDGLRGHVVSPVHLRVHGQAEGHPAHDGRLPHGVYATTKWVFDLHDTDVFWCTADIGWVTGHSYVVYGPLANGATTVMYEGTPDFPTRTASGASSKSTG